MSSQLDMNSLFETTNQKTLKRLETYDKILKQCHSRIKQYSKHERTTCFFAIPEFLIGVPLYDVVELRTYLMNSLEKNGFKLMYLHPNWLMIDWSHKKKEVKPKKQSKPNQPKKQSQTYKSIDEYKPSGSFVYNQSAMSAMSSLESKSADMLQVKTLNL